MSLKAISYPKVVTGLQFRYLIFKLVFLLSPFMDFFTATLLKPVILTAFGGEERLKQ